MGFRGWRQQPALERKDSGGVPSPEDRSRYKPWPVASPHTETSGPSLVNIVELSLWAVHDKIIITREGDYEARRQCRLKY